MMTRDPGPAGGSGGASESVTLEPEARGRRWSNFGLRHGIGLLFLLLFCVLIIVAPDFRRPENLWNILQQNSIIGIVACGMLVMMISGGFDLSVGSVGSLSTVVGAWMFVYVSLPAGVVAALIAGLAVGILNGLLITRLRINPFVTTLGTQVLIQGVVFVSTNGESVYGLPQEFTIVGLGHFGPVPVAGVIFAGVAMLTWIVLRFTTFGHYVYAVGGNKEASRLAGVPVDRVLVGAYALGGLFAAVAGIVLLGQTLIGTPTAASSWPLSAIAAVVVGGTPLGGGVGTVFGTIVGTMLLGVVANALNLFSVSPYWQPALTGLIILAAVGTDSWRRARVEGE